MIRIDMSEYGEKYTVSRLTGPPPGFVGYEEGGQLTEAVRRSPHAVILLDELEKAHPDVLNILLQVMDDGILTDGKGRTVSFKNTIIIMTSNIGSKKILDMSRKYEFEENETGGRPKYSKLAGVVKGELEKTLKPEFLNRIDDVVIFQPLTEDELAQIAARMALDIAIRTKLDRNIDIVVKPNLLRQMVKEGSQTAGQFGARPMRRAVQRILEDAISTAVMKNFIISGDRAIFDKEGDVTDGCDVEDLTLYTVAIRRSRDKETLHVQMEESCRDVAAEQEMVEELEAKYGKEEKDEADRVNGLQPARSTD